MFDKSRGYGKFYVVKSSAGDMYYRHKEEASHFGLPSEVWGFPVFNAADRLGKLPVAVFGSEAERDAAYPDAKPAPFFIKDQPPATAPSKPPRGRKRT